MTKEQRAEIEFLIYILRCTAAPIGPMHSYWDIIADLEEFLAGRPTILQKTAEEWIDYVKDMYARDMGLKE